MSQPQPEKKGGKLVIATNRSARHEYSILDTWEAGLSLLGSEVKSIRLGNVNLKESYVDFQSGEAILLVLVVLYPPSPRSSPIVPAVEEVQLQEAS